MKRSAMNISVKLMNSAIMTLSACARPERANSITPTPNASAKNEWNHHRRATMRFSLLGGGAFGSTAAGLPTPRA